jgi:hypothetical protein
MLASIVKKTQPTDILGALTTVVGLIGFAGKFDAGVLISTTLVVIGIAAVMGPRMFRFVVERWFQQTEGG